MDVSFEQLQEAFNKLPDANKEFANAEYRVPIMEEIRVTNDKELPEKVNGIQLRFIKKPSRSGYSYYLRLE
jgi:hypothetical protein